MRDGKRHPAAARITLLPAIVIAALMASPGMAAAQAPWAANEAPQPASKPAPPAAVPPAKATTAAPPPSAAEDLPWLATTTTPAGPAAAVDAKTPAPPAAKKPDVKKTAATPQKCEALAEDGCRALKTCAWVAAMPAADGQITPARCAERKVFAADKDTKKPKPVAAKPKPKPEVPAASIAAPVEPAPPKVTAKTDPAPEAQPENKPEAKTENKSETAAIPTPAVVEPAAAPHQKPAAQPVEAAKTPPPTMMPRPQVPFLQPPAEQAKTETTVAAPAPEKVLPAAEPTEKEEPLSIPGLVIAD